MKTVSVITGGTSGIGRAAALALARDDAGLVLVGQNHHRGTATARLIRQKVPGIQVRFIQADLSAEKDVHRLAQVITQAFDSVDVLINNAGARFDTYDATDNGIERTFATNHLGHFLLTGLLLGHLALAPSARVITVTSQAHFAAAADGAWIYREHDYDRRQAYAKSKLANILFAFELARRLRGTRIVSNAVDPGVAATRFARNNGAVAWAKHLISHRLKGTLRSPTAAADSIVYLATSAETETLTGHLVRNRLVVQASHAAQSHALAEDLWNQSAHLTGLDPDLGLSKSGANSHGIVDPPALKGPTLYDQTV